MKKKIFLIILFLSLLCFGVQLKLILNTYRGKFEILNRSSDKYLSAIGSSVQARAMAIQFISQQPYNQRRKLNYTAPISEVIRGTSGNDRIYFGYDHDNMSLKVVMNNTVSYYSKTGQSLTFDGGEGNDVIKAVSSEIIDSHRFGSFDNLNFEEYTIIGGRGNDHVEGTPFKDRIQGGTGNDYLVGKDGPDIIEGGDGADVIYGWSGIDIISGGNGDDYLFGDQDADKIKGDGGNDVVIGGGYDTLIGGEGRDIRHCRTNINADIKHDSSTGYNDFPCNCQDSNNIVDVEYIDIKDPYNDWTYMYHFGMVDGELIKIKYYTTSSVQELLRERSSGSILLMHNGEPLHVVHKQYDNTCGPSSVSMIMEYLGLADRNKRTQLPINLDITPATPVINRPLDAANYVDVGYFLSTEHIMYEGYHWKHHNSRLMSGYLDAGNNLNNAAYFRETADIKGIDYPIGNIVMNPDGTTRGSIQMWMKKGPSVGTANLNSDFELSHVVNKYIVGHQDAKPYNVSHFENIDQIKTTIREFVNHRLPLLVGVNNGRHFCVIMGYRITGNDFFVYLADPVDGWGLNPYYCKSMRWKKILLNEDVTRSGLICELMVFNHSNTDNGCALEGWAMAIDNTYDRKNLCEHIPVSVINTKYQLQLVSVECLDALEPRDQLMIKVNGENIWRSPRKIDNNGTLKSPRIISLEGINFSVLENSRVTIKLEEVDSRRRQQLGHNYISIAQVIRDNQLNRTLVCNINNVHSSHYIIRYRVVNTFR